MVRGNAKLLPLQNDSVQCVVTSPPFWALRSYGDHPDEVGEGDLKDYIEEMVLVGKEVSRVLKDDGLFWLNLGDTASKSGGAGGDYNSGGAKFGIRKWRQGESGLPRMNQCMVPSRVAMALQSDGWYLRQMIVWDKQQTRRADIKHEKKPLDAHEFIFLFSKTTSYFQRMDLLPEHGSVWHFPPVKGRRQHIAPFPMELPLRCITASTRRGDYVLDPFSGTGTTMEAATLLGRRGVGVDLYTEVLPIPS